LFVQIFRADFLPRVNDIYVQKSYPLILAETCRWTSPFGGMFAQRGTAGSANRLITV
jgi:hypothetical protein